MKAILKSLLVTALLFSLIGCGGGGGGDSRNESYAGGPSGTGVGTRTAEVTGVATGQDGAALAELLIGDLVGGESTFTDKNGAYRLFAVKNERQEIELFVRNESTNSEQEFRIATEEQDDTVQADITQRADGGFEIEAQSFEADTNIGGFVAPESKGGSSGKEPSTTEEFVTDNKTSDSFEVSKDSNDISTDDQISIESFEEEFEKNRGNK